MTLTAVLAIRQKGATLGIKDSRSTKFIKNFVVAVMILFMFSITAIALNFEIVVVDYNTLNPIENANVTLYTISWGYIPPVLIDSGLTDENGLVNFTVSVNNYTIVTTATGYEGDNRDYEVDTDDSLLIPLVPLSEDGIIRFRYSDLTGIRVSDWFGGDHEICIYYASNDRLQGCYFSNETIQLYEQGSYIIRIKPTRQDMINAPNSLLTFTKQFTNFLVMLIFIISIVGVLYYVQKTYITN